jgi:hypothetical protein
LIEAKGKDVKDDATFAKFWEGVQNYIIGLY